MMRILSGVATARFEVQPAAADSRGQFVGSHLVGARVARFLRAVRRWQNTMTDRSLPVPFGNVTVLRTA